MESDTEHRIEFVNRTRELAILQHMLEPEHMPGLLFLCGQPGLGKSRLTDELAARNAQGSTAFATVDPVLRANAGPASIYDGYFLQQCARSLDELAGRIAYQGLDTLESFLKERRWTSVREKKLGDAIRKFPSWESLYSVAFDYVERLFVFGAFGREQLLGSDSREAIAICQAYVDAMIEGTRLALVVRQAELIDHQSLRALLAFNRAASANLLIFEYATPGFGLGTDHDRLVQAELALHPNGHVFQLAKLENHHLELFLRQLSLPSQVIEWSTSARWDGNLRQLEGFQNLITVHSHALGDTPLPRLRGPADLDMLITDRVEALPATERVLLALVAVDAQPTERPVVLQAAQQILPRETTARLNAALGSLLGDARLLRTVNGALALDAPELYPAIARAPGFGAARVIAESTLRDLYVAAMRSDNAVVGPATAMRRALTLAARTGEPQLLLELLASCDARIASVNDQGLYVDLVAEAVDTGTDLLPAERVSLSRWAAGLAYDICDFRRCRALLATGDCVRADDLILLASCIIEDGDHRLARETLAELDRSASVAMMLAIDLLEGSIALDAGAWDVARMLLHRVVRDGHEAAPALAAHALRLLPEMLPYPDCTEVAIASVAMFEQAGLARASAFSAMSASRFLAREGRIEEARTMLERTALLRDSVRDEHMVRNNRALIELLSPCPDLAAATAELQLALRTSRDDFSDLSILCNLAIAHARASALEAALDCVWRGSAILDAPGFAERDVFWPVCFNFAGVLGLAGKADEAAAMLERPRRTGWKQRSNDAYWAWRYGETSDCADNELPYLHGLAWHPVALSHWQLDRETVATLTG